MHLEDLTGHESSVGRGEERDSGGDVFGFAHSPHGDRATIEARTSEDIPSAPPDSRVAVMRVAMNPGATALTVTPKRAHSTDRVRVMPIRPALAEE